MSFTNQIHPASRSHFFRPLFCAIVDDISQTSVGKYVTRTRVFQFLNAKVGRAAGGFLAGAVVEVVVATKGGQIGAQVGALAGVVAPYPGVESIGAAVGSVLGTAISGYYVAKKLRKSEQPFLGSKGYLKDTAVYLGAGGVAGMLMGPSMRLGAGGVALLSAKALYETTSKDERVTYSALFVASGGLALLPTVTCAQLALNAEMINEIRKADLHTVAVATVKVVAGEEFRAFVTDMVQGKPLDKETVFQEIISPIMTASTPLLVKQALLAIVQNLPTLAHAGNAIVPLLKKLEVTVTYNVLRQIYKDPDSTEREKQALATELNLALRDALKLQLPQSAQAEKIATGVVTKIMSQIDMLEEEIGAPMTKALLIGVSALVNNPDLLASYAHVAQDAVQSKINELTSGDLSTQLTQGGNLISEELGAAIDKAMNTHKALIDSAFKESVESLVVRAVKLVIGDDPKVYAKELAGGVVPDANNFFKRLIASLMNTTAAPLIKNAVHWVVKDAKFIADALVRTLNAFGPLLDKPKVKAAYENMHSVFRDERATESDKKAAAELFTKALRKAVCSKYPSLMASRHIYGKPVGLVAKSLAANIVAQFNTLETSLGAPIANALVDSSQKAFMQEYLSITLKYYIMVLVTNFLSFGSGDLTSEESHKFLMNAADYALRTQALPAPVADLGMKMLQKGIEVVRVFNGEMPPEKISKAARKANIASRFAYGSYKVVEAAVQETLSLGKSLKERATNLVSPKKSQQDAGPSLSMFALFLSRIMQVVQSALNALRELYHNLRSY